jgi:UDP-N-acetyl-D-glucosamine dehydrogenase
MRFTPGPGVGGHCLPIDPTYLSWKVETTLGKRFRFVELANEVNANMPEYVAFRVQRECEAAGIRLAAGARVLLLGLAFKRNTSDCREAPALRIAELLTERGAHVVGCDPHVLEMGQLEAAPLTMVPLTPDELELADAVVLVTDHSEFDARMVLRHARWVLDTRHMLHESDNVEYL